jgi:nucleoside-diphosphate-sugar epimerase
MGCPVALREEVQKINPEQMTRFVKKMTDTLLNWEPQVPLAEGIAKTIEYFRGRI